MNEERQFQRGGDSENNARAGAENIDSGSPAAVARARSLLSIAARRANHGGMEAAEMRRTIRLERGNRRLKRVRRIGRPIFVRSMA